MTSSIRKILASVLTPLMLASGITWGFTSLHYLYIFIPVYIGIVVIGAPVYFHLSKQNALLLPPILFGTFVMGSVLGIALAVNGGPEWGPSLLIGMGITVLIVVAVGVIGMVSGLLWWFIAVAKLVLVLKCGKTYNKAKQSDNLRGIEIAV